MYFMDCGGVSHLGTSKKINEDRFVIADVRPETTIRNTNLDLSPNTIYKGRPYGNYTLVSDGSGDPDDAARASTIVMDCFVRSLMDELRWSLPLDATKRDQVANQLADSFELCQGTIFREARVLEESRIADMSASLALAWVGWPQVATAGSCRVLLVRHQKLEFCSHDENRSDSNTLSNERLIEFLSSPVSASADAKNTVAVHFTQDREQLREPEQRYKREQVDGKMRYLRQ